MNTNAVDLTVDHTDFAARLSFFGSGTGLQSYKFKGTLDDASGSVTSEIDFSIQFSDACRTSSIHSQAISLAPVTWDASSTSI